MPRRTSCQRAFTLLDLVVTLAIIAVLALTLVPALAKSGGKATRVNCFNNKRHIQAACAMYSAEWNDWLVPAAPGDTAGWCRGQENWQLAAPNVVRDYYSTNALGRYLKDLRAYKCPNDKILSDNGDRIRSVSMNGAIAGGTSAVVSIQSIIRPYRVYFKTADLTVPGPANTWVFCDESMYSMNDGYLEVDLTEPGTYPDVPANYDSAGNCFSFADGHAEYRKWLFNSNGKGPLRNVPYSYGVVGTFWRGGGEFDLDWSWLRQHTSSL